MFVIEPCCYRKQLNSFFQQLNVSKELEMSYETNSDWTLGQLIEWLIWLAPSGTISLILPDLTENTIESLSQLLIRKHVSVGRDEEELVKKINIIVPNRSTFDKPFVRKIKDKYPDRVFFGYSNSSIEMLLIDGENPNDNNKTSCYALTGSFNQSIDYKSRIINVTRSTFQYADLKSYVDRHLRIHPVK